MKDSLGDRMKHQYENRTRTYLPRRTFTVIRLDGKAFHIYTKGRIRPWDHNLNYHLVNATAALCRQAQGCLMGFVQSDEVSLLLADFATTQTEAWFDGNTQKIASVSASILTAHFNIEEGNRLDSPAYFDARVFTIPDPVEVHNYFVWRQKDIERNSLSMLAQAHFPHRELQGLKRDGLHDKLHTIGINWNDMPEAFKRGTLVRKTVDPPTIRSQWMAEPAPIFTQEPVVQSIIARYETSGD